MPWALLIWRPRRARAHLEALYDAGMIAGVPTPFQAFCGVLYMVHRLLFRSDTIGLAEEPVRSRLFRWRPARFPFLVAERAIMPFDLTGFGSSPDLLERHLLAAYHPGDAAVYDLALLAAHPGRLERLRDEVAAIVAQDTRRARFLADLCAYEGYHARLLDLVDRALGGTFAPRTPGIPADTTLAGFVDWCLDRPSTFRDTLRGWLDRPVMGG